MDAQTPRTDPTDESRLALIKRRGRALRSRRRLVAAGALGSVLVGMVAVVSAPGLTSKTQRVSIAASRATAARTAPPKHAPSSTSTTITSPSRATAPPSRTTPPNDTRPPPSSPPTLAPSPSIVQGRITAGPTCPVEQIGHPCPPAPVVETIEARDQDGQTIATTRSQSDGSYSLQLQPGSYVLVVVTESIFPSCTPVDVTVTAGASTTADISCDTGIR